MITIKKLLPLVCIALAATGCIRDEIADCPPLTVTLSVKDKNYFNVDDVDLVEARAEDLPFRDYVSNLHWSLRDAKSGKIIDESPAVEVTGNEQTVGLNISPDIPFGDYVLTVWGGLSDADALSEAKDQLRFHPANLEGDDVYMTCLHLTYDAWHYDYTAEMERTKGKLIIEKINLPSTVTASDKSITGLYGAVDHEFTYSGVTSVTKHAPVAPGAQVISETLLSPSVEGERARLHTVFHLSGAESRADATTLTPADVDIELKRNELTVVRYLWNDEKQEFEIYVLIDATWRQIIKLDVDI